MPEHVIPRLQLARGRVPDIDQPAGSCFVLSQHTGCGTQLTGEILAHLVALKMTSNGLKCLFYAIGPSCQESAKISQYTTSLILPGGSFWPEAETAN
eukprot:1373024-Pleurochrysis_carterae.AAC.1